MVANCIYATGRTCEESRYRELEAEESCDKTRTGCDNRLLKHCALGPWKGLKS